MPPRPSLKPCLNGGPPSQDGRRAVHLCQLDSSVLLLTPAWLGRYAYAIRKGQFMIEHTLDKMHSVLYLRPKTAFEAADFAQLARTVDPYIGETGSLKGLIIDAPAFPGWQSLGAVVAHFRFVRDHQKHIKKVALVTSSALGNVAEHLASHFVSAEIKHFPAGDMDAATHWVEVS